MPQWKHNPPCKAHTILSQMFADGKIDPATTAKAAFSFHPEFANKKFRKSSSSALSCLEDSANSSSTSSLIVSRKRLRDDQESDLNEEIEDLDSRIIHQNQPVLMAVYKDHSLAEIVSICVTLPSGVTDIRFTLDGTGPATTFATITYTWPQVMFDIEGLFASAIKKKKTMTVEHPKIIALKLELENNRQHIDRKPQGSMEISLPIPVKTDPNTVNYKLAKGTDGVIAANN
ncbi:hypothetical protein OUZ56_019457 [Daphnia magna]|uniref:Uncharacterized protein n=1 Tax=Daphnia magna TaxID=35525 RepID=A0ABQ9ZBM7_9CRUS|nr:hypothetical protein OUZ56_019457 [Daphnia magna]